MTEKNKKLTITIDGPAGAGKSTIAKQIAKKLNISYLDTGAMYRAVTLKGLKEGVNFEDTQAIVELAKKASIHFEREGDTLKVILDGKDVSDAIRTQDVTNATFYVARESGVRAIMVELQREIGNSESIVAEGRDIGTVVFPEASNKFYLDADVDERARRRIKELKEGGHDVNDQELTKALKQRDKSDTNREAGPLKKAEDAIVINSTDMSVDEVVDEILKNINTDE